ncbi:hypothetical protein CK203_102860 [Vitis vinifera]|uniref:Reverse transcriptase domain-containing protein n=1 Tax=Vitis vinifera TaxID=29760 RepID=A0A438D0C6_VITVI|nr:hypothetical protein CK203_102860 [Vitis vinifera]
MLAMEALSQLLFKSKSSRFISGFKVGRSSGEGIDVSHHLFADNTLIFCEINSDQLRYLRGATVEDVASMSGCKVRKLPTSYLGLPLGAPFKSFKVCSGREI